MKLFNLKNKTVTEIQLSPFKLEKEIQNIIENNSESIFNLKFIKSELSVGKYRIDSLCYDEESKSIIIIEYKKGSSYSVIDQGFSYLQLLLNNKSDFVLLLSQHFNKVLSEDDLDWSQSKIIFISPSFNSYQRDSVNFKDVPFELWEIHKFSNNTFTLNELKSESTESIKFVGSSKNSVIKNVSKEIKKYTEDEHLNGIKFKNYSIPKSSDQIKELYFKFKDNILNNFQNVELKINKCEIGFKKGKRCFVYFYLGKDHIKLWINLKKGSLNDNLNISRDVSSVGHWGVGDYEVKVDNDSNFEYVLSLIRQSYEKSN
jgi:predicted transport protein